VRAAWLLVLLGACAHGGKSTGGGEAFTCNERRAEYIATGTIVAPVTGVRLLCDGDRPIVEEYTASEGGADEKATRAFISEVTWEKSWKDLESLGWRRASSCPGDERPRGKKAPKEVVYVFEIRDAEGQVSLICRGESPPFPFAEMREALDRAAIEGREPSDPRLGR
jgi:hypothetical protein